ncbi:hypothetical protein COT51_02405 [candidate division WWE3 bacterium CG08_land_8_20_14_0_20_41_15]|uniref:Uncharacterized protein n=2 Tax=Katanobacteria TaxID=422282 RepID=A0A2H0X9H4_UNCKA|nr:MAG: hypothetical protein COT51_02405 [candidate division WWE3 bacterium CG08_land_8_20_14_0_20_41_15]
MDVQKERPMADEVRWTWMVKDSKGEVVAQGSVIRRKTPIVGDRFLDSEIDARFLILEVRKMAEKSYLLTVQFVD